MEIGLVSCTKSKREQASLPKNLYDESVFFKKASQYVKVNHDEWYILSAKHGLLEPDGETIEPYDDTLSGATTQRKKEWSNNVYQQLREKDILTDVDELVFHTGRDYYDELLPLLDDAEYDVMTRTPTDGLQYGETLAWYNDHL